jgi:hypothetical protein
MPTILARGAPRNVLVTFVVTGMLSLAACTTGQFSAPAICEATGSHWVDGACQLTSDQLALKQWCETHGGVYLRGNDDCAFGEGP